MNLYSLSKKKYNEATHTNTFNQANKALIKFLHFKKFLNILIGKNFFIITSKGKVVHYIYDHFSSYY